MSIERVEFKSSLKFGQAAVSALLFLSFCLSFVPAAGAQAPEFALQPSPLSPDAVAPGGVSSLSIQVVPQTGFAGTVNLSCQVSATITTTDTPVCTVTPSSVTAPAVASATITTKTTSTETLYNVSVTGTDPATSFTTTTPTLNFTVLAVTPQFTITVASAVAPNSVIAGNGAQGVVSVNAANGYITPTDGGITLSCGSITPLVTIPPVCSFTYPTGGNVLKLSGATAASATLNISTFGPITTGEGWHTRSFYAVWLAVPFLGFTSIGTTTGSKKTRKAWLMLSIFVISALFLLIPACGTNTSNTTSTPNGTTPANTYTFTIVGVDSNGVVSSNVSATNTGPTVSLTVTAPPKTN